MTALMVVLGVIVFLILYVIVIYNRLVKLKNRFEECICTD